MRRFARLAFAVALLMLVPATPAAAPHLGGSNLDPVLVLWGCPPGTVSQCTFTVQTWNRTLLFFRFDFNADGVWDYPSQIGSGPLGRWTTLTQVTWTLSAPFVAACAQAWDGISTETRNGTTRPAGPIGCTSFAEFRPRWWNRHSPGRFVLVKLTIPGWLDPQDFDVTRAEVEGLAATPLGRPSPNTVLFHVDRAALTRLLSPGANTVHLTLPWAGMTFTAAGQVTLF